MEKSKSTKLQVQCPHCRKKFLYYSSEFRPFCCEKCKLIDLGKWLDEGYSVPVAKGPHDDESDSDTFVDPEERDRLDEQDGPNEY